MRGTNPAWLIPVATDGKVTAACLSGTLIRNRKSVEQLVAFISKSVSNNFIPQLAAVFDHIIFAPVELPCEAKNMLLLQSLTLSYFSSLVIVEPGTYVEWSFDHALEKGCVINEKGDWILVALSPNLTTYLNAVSSLNSGKSFDNQFIMDFLATRNAGGDEIGYSWSTLKYYNGLRMPLVSLTPEMISTLQKTGIIATGFWQKVLLSEILPVIRSVGETQDQDQHQKSWIAIVGMSCRFPGSNSVEEYWEILRSGLSTASVPPSHRLGKCELKEGMRANFLKCPIDEFDAPFFAIPPSTAASMDPQARILLEVSWEAFEDAGINPEKLRAAPVGVFYGSWLQEYKDMVNLGEKPEQDFFKKYSGCGFGASAAKVSFFYGFTGPNITTESSCCSSMMAVQLACENLQNGKCPLALAAGANVILQMDQDQKVIWATDGICRSFDSCGNGYGRGEGIGVLVLKRYFDAIRDGDRIHGIIRGSATAQEGLSPSFATPTVENEARSMETALFSAQVHPVDVDYVEAHATGTRVGDPIEAEATVKAYSSPIKRQTPLLVGSVKTNIGHAESCSGIASIIKVLLAMKHETIPAHINVNSINPKVDFSPIPGKLTLETEEWKRSAARPRIAGVSNFGISGTDVHMIIQEPPKESERTREESPLYILAFSAKTSPALEQLTKFYVTFLEEGNDTLADITYTANACRAHLHPFRRAVVAATREELICQLRNQLRLSPQEPEGKLELCFICDDLIQDKTQEQVATLYSQFPAFQISMDVCDAVCKDTTGFSPVASLLNNKISCEGEQWQFCTFSITYSLYKLWESWGVKGSAVLGLNFGELVGAAIAGELELAQCFKVIMNQVETAEKNCEKAKIRYFSARKGTDDLGPEHLKGLRWKLKENQSQRDSVLSTTGCDIFIHLDLQGKLELREGRRDIVANATTGGLFSSLATLYMNGYPVEWEGVHAHQRSRKVSLPHYPFQRKSIWFKRNQGAHQQINHPELWNSNVHPLLGSYLLPTAESNSCHSFENLLSFHEQAPYLSSHVIGSEIIFPAAGHLELLLAAASFQDGHSQGGMLYTVENFQICQPLHLPSNSSKILRTTMSQIETGWNIVVESQTESENWNRYASGEVMSRPLQKLKVDLDELKSRLVENESAVSEFYQKVANFGLNFGKEFKSLQNIYESESTHEVLAQVGIPRDAVHYICHPLLVDAMIQIFLFQKRAELTTLTVPVGINKFVCHRRLSPAECSGSSATCFIYFKESEQTIFLLDSSGAPIATMTELEVKATTINSVLSAAGLKNSGELDFWQTLWKPATTYQTEGSLSSSPNCDFTKSPNFISLLRSLERRNSFTIRDQQISQRVSKLSELFVYKAFAELGWEPKRNQTFLVTQLATEFDIPPNFYNAFRYYLSYFENNGVIEISGQNETTTCKVVGLMKKKESIENDIAELSKVLVDYEPLESLIACASALSPIMQGKIKGQQILFEPGKGGVTHADIIYKANTYYKNVGKAGPNVFFEIAAQLWHNEKDTGKGRKLRILEVGAGTGVFTNDAIPLLEEDGIEYSYHYTDVSSHFLKKAESRFPHLVYKTLDLERDPLEQGFPPAFFDIVVGLDVVHATKHLEKSVGHLRMLLKIGGHLLLGETNKPIKEFDVTFGILDGYWHFNDHDIRPTHCTMSAEKWLDLLNQSGFRGPSCKVLLANSHLCVVVGTLSCQPQLIETTDNEVKTWILLHDMDKTHGWARKLDDKMRALGRKLMVIHPKKIGDFESYSETNLEGILCFFKGEDSLASNNCRSILEPLLNACKFMIEKRSWSSVPRLCVATSGLWKEADAESNPSVAALWGFVRSARMELPWLTTKLVDLDPDVELELRIDALLQEIWMGDDETEAVYREGVRYTRRLTQSSPATKNIVPIPSSKDYTIQLPTSNLIQDLIYIPKKIEKLSENEVIVEVRAAALNFRDVFSVLKPSERFSELDTMGMDFSGVVSSDGGQLKRGTPVFGVCFDKSTISGYISIPTQNLLVVPDGLSFGEAATLPVAFLTAWHCLINVAHGCSGQTILIHAASGGVGLVAVQIAKHLGLNIVATAGSQRKRNFLRNLGILHVFNSRTLEFGQKIKEITNGHGVDIVLNCLTGAGFKETSLGICKDGGHFVEISKLDIWEEQEVKARKPGVNYNIIDLSVAEPILVGRLLASLSKMLGGGFLTPLPYTRFTASRIVSALQFLQKAKQIGKVVVDMPHFDIEQNIFKEMLFNERSSYLITGGKGAIGLAIAEWMVSHGANYLVLLGRNPPKEKALAMIQKLEEEAGAKLLSMEGDVADYDEMSRVFQAIHADPNLPPLRGIHHCAGVLSDDMVVNQDWDSFDYSLNPKVKGSYNLHLLSSQARLEFFVVHSSLTCVLGNLGQSNHTSGCLYTEALMESRVRNGLPGMSISWGQWNAGLAENREVEMLTAFTISQGIAALERFFLENRGEGGAGFVKVQKLCQTFPAYEKTFLEGVTANTVNEERAKETENTEEKKVSLPELYEKADGDEEQKQEMIKKVVRNMLCETLGLPLQEVGGTVKFSRMGLDSLMSIEFYSKLQSAMGKIELGYIDMEQQGTVDEISYIVQTALDKALV